MSRVLHDLCLVDDRRPSPFCWRVKLALAHKGLEYEARPVAFTAIGQLCGGGYRTVPILEDGGRVLGDSWAIADHLDEAYPERPRLFASPAERGLCRFTEAWILLALGPTALPMIARDIHDLTLPEDRAYFRESREKRLGRTLEEAAAGREERLPALREALSPLRMTLTYQKQSFLSGEQPGYADYIVAGCLLWIASVSTLPVLAADDPVVPWFDRVRAVGGVGDMHPLYPLAG